MGLKSINRILILNNFKILITHHCASRMSLALRGIMRNAAKLQVRSFAAKASETTLKEGEMALTFAAGNKVYFLVVIFLILCKQSYDNDISPGRTSKLLLFLHYILLLLPIFLTLIVFVF